MEDEKDLLKEGAMEKYICPVCKEEIDHDLVVFLKHTDPPLIANILKEHPQWAHGAGICKECLEYYRKSIGHNAFLEDIEDTAS